MIAVVHVCVHTWKSWRLSQICRGIMHVCIELCFILADRRNRWRLTRETRFHLFIPNLGIDIVCFFEVIQMRRRVESFYDKNTAIFCLASFRWATMTAVDFVTSRLFCVFLFFHVTAFRSLIGWNGARGHSSWCTAIIKEAALSLILQGWRQDRKRKQT